MTTRCLSYPEVSQCLPIDLGQKLHDWLKGAKEKDRTAFKKAKQPTSPRSKKKLSNEMSVPVEHLAAIEGYTVEELLPKTRKEKRVYQPGPTFGYPPPTVGMSPVYLHPNTPQNFGPPPLVPMQPNFFVPPMGMASVPSASPVARKGPVQQTRGAVQSNLQPSRSGRGCCHT